VIRNRKDPAWIAIWKSSFGNLSGYDWEANEVVRLFHPRHDDWEEHFAWEGPWLRGKTQIGRVTIDVLTINAPSYVELRESLIGEGLFPPQR
jgi:hypothetical protein